MLIRQDLLVIAEVKRAMKALEITVSGEVQGVGYRRVVQSFARGLSITGYVENRADGTVKIVAQGREGDLQKFLEAVAIKEPPVRVVKVEKKERRPTAKYKVFSIKPGSLVQELQEGLGAGEGQLALFRKEFRDYRSEFKDYREEFKGFAKRTDDNFATLAHSYAEIAGKLTEVLETLEKESLETRREFTEALETLRKESLESRKEFAEALRTLQAESREARKESAEALDVLRKESLETRKELTRAVDNLSRLVEQSVKGQG